jgi:hypothetical protein
MSEGEKNDGGPGRNAPALPTKLHAAVGWELDPLFHLLVGVLDRPFDEPFSAQPGDVTPLFPVPGNAISNEPGVPLSR